MPQIRTATPADYDAVAPVLDDWWGTSLVIDGPGLPDAFLVGILAPDDPGTAYIHFVGVAPRARRRGYGRLLYEEFFRRARAGGRSGVSAITAPVNLQSADFHRAMGFTVTGPVPGYNGPGHDMLVLERAL